MTKLRPDEAKWDGSWQRYEYRHAHLGYFDVLRKHQPGATQNVVCAPEFGARWFGFWSKYDAASDTTIVDDMYDGTTLTATQFEFARAVIAQMPVPKAQKRSARAHYDASRQLALPHTDKETATDDEADAPGSEPARSVACDPACAH